MITDYNTQIPCATCKKELYPHESFRSKYLCGEELCSHTPKIEKFLACSTHYFCSDNCFRDYEATPRNCNINRWDHILQQVINAAHTDLTKVKK